MIYEACLFDGDLPIWIINMIIIHNEEGKEKGDHSYQVGKLLQ